MIPMVEEYERCWHLGGYMGQECELCPHRNECRKERDGSEEILRSESKRDMRVLWEGNGKGR